MDIGFTVWFTGKLFTGKAALGCLTAEMLADRDCRVEFFDAEVLRKELWLQWGYSLEESSLETKIIAYFCHSLNEHGVVTVVSALSSDRQAREQARQLLENFIEIHLEASLDTIKSRNHEGKFHDDELDEVCRNYEPPENPELKLDTSGGTGKDILEAVIVKLEEMGYIEPSEEDYTEEEKHAIDERLKSLGYM